MTPCIDLQMPHYHAAEAMAALKPVLGAYYKSDSREVPCRTHTLMQPFLVQALSCPAPI